MTREPDKPEPETPASGPVAPDWAAWEGGEERQSLVELVNRVLDRGVLLHGDVTLSVAGVDLVYLGLNALLTSVSTARRTLGRGAVGEPLRPAAAEPPALGEGTPPSPAVGSLHGGSAAQPDAGTPPARSGVEAVSDALASQLVEVAEGLPSRIDVDPDAVQQDLARLVLTIVELVRQVVEHQAVRRMEDGDLSELQVERMGIALLRLQEKMRDIKSVFGLADDDLNIDLGPLGKLL